MSETSPPPSPSQPPRLWRSGTLAYTSAGLAILFCWLLWGDFAYAMRDRTVPGVVQLLFKRFGASDTLVGILFSSLPAAIGLVVGPVVGYRSDRLRSRWGRRIPFLAIPTPFIVLSMAGMAFAPQIGAALQRLTGGALDPAILLCLALCWGVFEISCITANSVFSALINDVVPQEVVGRFFGLFRAVSLLAGMGVTYWVLGKAESHYVPIFLGIGALYGVGFALMCLKVKEGEYPPPPEPSAQEKRGRLAAVHAYFRDGFSHPYYLWYFAFSLLVIQATVPFNLYSVFYAKSVGLDLTTYFRCYTWVYGVSLCLAYPLGVLADRFHPLRVSLAVSVCYALVMAGGFLVHDGASFLVVQVAHGVLSGTLYTVSASLAQRLLPRSKFAELASVGGVLGSLFGMALAPVIGAVLDHTNHSYRYVFHAGLVLNLAALVTGAVLYRKFAALGGPRNYRAPE